MRTVALIPIKFLNRRVPGKNIKPFFDGTPLMHLIQDVCLRCRTIDETYIYCSDDAVKEYVLPGIKYIKRPEYLDGDDINANDFISEFMKTINADIYVNTHSTCPFTKPETIDECVERVASGEYDSAFTAENIKSHMWMNGRTLNYDLNKHFPRTQDLPDIYAESSNAYVFTKDMFLKYHRRIGNMPYIKEVDKIEGMDIDWPEDFEIADAIYRVKMGKKEDGIR